jgi:hypothetical protein
MARVTQMLLGRPDTPDAVGSRPSSECFLKDVNQFTVSHRTLR